MKRAIFVFLATVILLVSARTMTAMCILVGADTTVVCVTDLSGTECWVTYYEYWDCIGGGGDTTGGGTSPPTGGGTRPPPGPQPQISIVSISDENPGNPMLQVSTSNVDFYDLYINGGFQNSISGSTTNVILPSLDPRSGQLSRNSTLELMAYNNNGQANASMSVDRPSSQPSTQQGMYVRYYDSSQGGLITREVNMTRSLTTLVIYTNYSVQTSGARNGRVFHWSVEDVIGWDGFHPTPSWGSFYYMSSLPVASFWDERPCGARFAGPANQSGLCADPTSFAFDGQASATAKIPNNGFAMGDPNYTPQIVPNEITVNP